MLFADVTGSTALGERLEAETLRRVMERYFELARRVIERHGGTVEKFIGDAVMAVFGVPVSHEDDALRAVRAAADLRAELPQLNTELERDYNTSLQLRTGVNTGEAVTATDDWLAVGDAVNVAARLEQVADPGEILLGEETLRLVVDAVVVEELEPRELKGKAKPVAAYRLLEVSGEPGVLRRRLDTPMVGRAPQLAMLQSAVANVVRDRTCSLFTLLGVAGVGKSRLAAEFLATLDATVVSGRCLSYGEGITYLPVVEVVKQLLATEPNQDTLAQMGEEAAVALGNLLGEATTTSPGEIAWAVRKLFERAASTKPLVVVFDDVHWGEQTFLELIEHVTDLSRGVPILLLCMARPELLDRQPGWGGGKLNATTVLLEPLNAGEADELIERLLPADEARDSGLRERVREVAAGNPLFLEEIAAVVATSGGTVSIPPTIQALLAARLDQLEPGERRVLERGSVEGQSFHRGAVQALGADDTDVPARLLTLLRKDIIRPEETILAGDDAFRFRHLLIRDAAYEGLPKSVRAELHERFAHWLDERGGDLAERDEIVGYHLEQAYRYRRDLGAVDADAETVGAAAAERLEAAGRRALDRSDASAAMNLLERASSLMPSDRLDISLEVGLVWALFLGARPVEAVARAEAAAARAAIVGDTIGQLQAELAGLTVRTRLEPEGRWTELEELVKRAGPVLEQAGNDAALSVLWYSTSWCESHRGRSSAAGEAALRALEYADRAGEQYMIRMCKEGIAGKISNGTMPIDEALAWLEHAKSESQTPDPWLDVYQADLLAAIGRFEEARDLHRSAANYMADRGMRLFFLHTGETDPFIEWRAGDLARAEQAVTQLCKGLEEIGDWTCWGQEAVWLAQVLYEQGRYDEAETWARRGSEAAGSNSSWTQLMNRLVLARVAARDSRFDEARDLAAEALELVDGMESPFIHGMAALNVAEALSLVGDRAAAIEQAERAASIYEAKGATVDLDRALRFRAMLESSASAANS